MRLIDRAARLTAHLYQKLPAGYTRRHLFAVHACLRKASKGPWYVRR